MIERSLARKILGLGVSLLTCYAVAALGGWWTAGAVASWYPKLVKPPLNPPNWVFGPVWSLLYTMMAVAAWLVWKRVGMSGGKVPLGLFAGQLALNLIWSWLFFAMHSPALGAIDIVLMWATILATTLAFWKVSPIAGAMMVPYLLWVSFATYLNLGIWWLNASPS